jgi:hypothetical protein
VETCNSKFFGKYSLRVQQIDHQALYQRMKQMDLKAGKSGHGTLTTRGRSNHCHHFKPCSLLQIARTPSGNTVSSTLLRRKAVHSSMTIHSTTDIYTHRLRLVMTSTADDVSEMTDSRRGLGIDMSDNNGGHVYPSPPPDDRPELTPSDERERLPQTEPERTDKDTDQQPVEIADEIAAATGFTSQSASPEIKNRRPRSNTNPRIEGAQTIPRTQSPTHVARTITPARNPNQTSRRKGGERQSSGTVPVVHNYGSDPIFDEPAVPKDKASTTRILKNNSNNGMVFFPPVPFQSYLSLALASPTSSGFPDLNAPPETSSGDGSPTKPSGPIYGKLPHDPDDAASIALERLTNFFTLPPKLEVALTFGVLACLDSWLYIFTILPLRFLKAVGVLMTFWRKCIWDYFFYDGNKLRKRGTGASGSNHNLEDEKRKSQTKRRSKARNISGLNPNHKADILRGAILFTTCWFLMRFDASKMYHSIRGQSGIKLYVIYNMLDVSFFIS